MWRRFKWSPAVPPSSPVDHGACRYRLSDRGFRSWRAHGGPKALLFWTDGAPLAVSHARMRSEVRQAVVVARAAVAARLRPWLPMARVISSSAPGSWGPAGSIAAAVRAGAFARDGWVLITPVDLVPTRFETVAALFSAAERGGEAVRPVCAGRGGHPVLVRVEVLVNAYLVAGTPPPLRDVLRALGPGCVQATVDDPDIRADLDTPDVYRARTGHGPRFAR